MCYFIYCSLFPVGEFSVTYALKLIYLWGLIFFVFNKEAQNTEENISFHIFTY